MKKYIFIVLGLLLVGCAPKGYTTALTQGVTAINEQQYDEAQQHFEAGDRNMYVMSVVKFGGATLTNGQVIAATPTSVTIQYNVSQPEFNGEVTGQGNVTYQLEGETWKVADAQWTPNTTVCVQEECVPAHELNHR